MEEQVQIDIDCLKIVEWLESRKKIPKDWSRKLKAVQLKLHKFIETCEMPQYPEIQKCIQDNLKNFGFYNLHEVIELLLSTEEAKQKTFFGNFASKLMTDWLSLSEMFKKDNLDLVDCAKSLSQMICFELPALKKSIAMQNQQITECINKAAQCRNNASQCQNDYNYLCKKYNIQGRFIEKEVSELVCNIPPQLKAINNLLQNQDLSAILQLYQDFCTSNNTRFDPGAFRQSKYALFYIVKFGDTLVDVYRDAYSKNANENAIELELKARQEDESQKYDNYNLLVQEIPMIQEQQDYNENDIDIDNTNNIEIGDEQMQTQDEWAIQIVDEGALKQNSNEHKKPTFQDTLLSCKSTREQVITSLYEVDAFLQQRINETQNFSGNALVQAYDPSSQSAKFEEVSLDQLKIYKGIVFNLINLLTGPELRTLLNYKEQPKSILRVVEQLRQVRANRVKNILQSRDLLLKEKEINRQLADDHELLAKFSQQTKRLKIFIEENFLTNLKIKVSITGEICKVK